MKNGSSQEEQGYSGKVFWPVPTVRTVVFHGAKSDSFLTAVLVAATTSGGLCSIAAIATAAGTEAQATSQTTSDSARFQTGEQVKSMASTATTLAVASTVTPAGVTATGITVASTQDTELQIGKWTTIASTARLESFKQAAAATRVVELEFFQQSAATATQVQAATCSATTLTMQKVAKSKTAG